jgi:hypothetical protein
MHKFHVETFYVIIYTKLPDMFRCRPIIFRGIICHYFHKNTRHRLNVQCPITILQRRSYKIVS